MTSLRWRMMALLMIGSIINYLTRSTLGVAAPTILQDLHITTQQYSWIVGTFQGAIMLQPICGYVLDVVGLKAGFAMFAIAWSLVSMAHGLAHSWPAFAVLRGLLGFSEGCANPAGMKATAEWFPAKERGLAGGLFNIGASLGSMLAPPLVVWAILAYNWQAAFVMTGLIGLAWVALWLTFYHSPDRHPTLSAAERDYIVSGQEQHLRGDGTRPSIGRILRQRNFWGIALPRFLADPTWGTLTFWMPLYLNSVRHFDLKQIALFAWMPFLAADLGSMFGGVVSLWLQKHAGLSLINARRGAFTVGAVLMMGMAFVGFVDNPYTAIALLCLGGFAHQTLSVTVITMASDLFKRNEVATVAGLAGTCGNGGVLVFSLIIGALVAAVGYTPFFICLGVLDLIGALLLWTLVREPARRPYVMSTVIRNPILRGFNPDPSIVRVGDDYFIATSTFEWFPGVQIHHSRDLVNWRLLTRPLRRASQLNMLGDPDSCGVWAPDLTYADGRFYLVYTDVKRYGRTTVAGASGASLRDFHNYLVTSTDIDGDWSDPVYLNSSGFDPSLFHDDDGKKYLLNMLWDHRPGQNRFAGIVMQEFSPAEQRLVGERRLIFSGTALGLTEGPHVYKRGGYYHLITAEGGTSWGHAVTMARATDDRGPLRVASRRPRVERASSAGRRAAACRPRGSRRHARRQHLHGVPVRPAAAQPRTVHARTGDRDSEDGLGRRRMAPDRRRRWSSVGGNGSASRCCAADRATATGPRALRRRAAADRFPVAAIAVARRVVQPDRASRIPAALRPRNGRQPVQAGARRAPAAVALLQRVDDRRVRAAALPADGRADLLLQQLQVPLPAHLHGRRRRQARSGHVGAARPGAGGRVHSPARDSVECRRGTARRDRLRASSFRVSRQRCRMDLDSAAIRCQHPLRRSDGAGAAELHRRLRRHRVPGHVRRTLSR